MTAGRVVWGAIFAGVVVALVVQVLLTMLGAGIGMATLDPASADNSAASTFSISAAVWWVVSGIIAAFAGGYIAARMSGRTAPPTGARKRASRGSRRSAAVPGGTSAITIGSRRT